MWGKSENNPFYGAQVWFSNMFNTPRNGQLGHLGDDLSVRLAIGWNDGVQIQGNLSPRYPSQRILPPSFKLFFCSGKGCAQKCSIPRNWIFMEKLLKKHSGFTWILYVWHSRKIRRSIVARGTAPRTQPLRRRFSFKPRKRLDVWAWSSQPPSMENIKGPVQLRSCTHGWPQAVSARRESWNRPNRGEDVNGNIGTTESKTTISFDNLQNTPWFDNTSWMNQ